MGDVFKIQVDGECYWVEKDTEILLDRITVISGEDVKENSLVLARCADWFRERELSIREMWLKDESFLTAMRRRRTAGFPAARCYVITEPERNLHPVQVIECVRGGLLTLRVNRKFAF